MKVKIRDLKPNPYRDMKRNPLNEDKVNSLVGSIEQTGFWDNILARKEGDIFQLAYGHHRLKALKKVMDLDDTIDIPVKKLSDAVMVQIMANENNEDWSSTPAIIDETVNVTKKFLKDNPEAAAEYGEVHSKSASPDAHIGKRLISRFLGWPENRVEDSLFRLGLIEDNILHQVSVEKMPTNNAARTFAEIVKRENLTPLKQARLADKIVESKNFGRSSMLDAAIETKFVNHPKKKVDYRSEKIQEFEEYCNDLKESYIDLCNKTNRFIALKKAIGDFEPGPRYMRLEAAMSTLINLAISSINNKKHQFNGNSSVKNLKRITA